MRTRITDLLEAHGIAYRLLPHTEPVFTVEAAAAQRGVIKEEMVKSIAQCQKVNISSGDPLAGLELATQDLIELAGAKLAAIAKISNRLETMDENSAFILQPSSFFQEISHGLT